MILLTLFTAIRTYSDTCRRIGQSRTLAQVKEENEKKIQTLSESEPLAFDWNTTIYSNVRQVVETPTVLDLIEGEGEVASQSDCWA